MMGRRPTRNRAPLILLATVAAGGGAFAVTYDPHHPGSRTPLVACAAIVIAGIVVMMLWQASAYRARAPRAEPETVPPETSVAAGLPPADPTQLDADGLAAALAVRAVDEGRTRGAQAEQGRMVNSLLGFQQVLFVVILVGIVPLLAFKSYVGLVVAFPVAFGLVAWRSVNTVRRGGVLDRAYAVGDVLVAPLGLTTIGRPRLVLVPRVGQGLDFSVMPVGSTVLGGQRHGRDVEVRIAAWNSMVIVAKSAGAFTVESHGGRLQAADGAPARVTEALAALSASPHWERVEAQAGPDGIAVVRRGSAGGAKGEWILDLWLAERLADAAHV